MADRCDELIDEINQLKELVAYQSTTINKLILMINLSDSDLKNYLHILE
jgi:hypothetical protein